MPIDAKVTEYMTVKLIKFSPDMDIQDATQSLLKNNISGAPVVNENGDLVGILSEHDCLKLILDGQYNQRPSGLGTVAEFMSTDIRSLDVGTTVSEAAYRFVNGHFRRFPITENGRLVGQISRRDILEAIDKQRPKVNIVPDTWKVRKPML